MMDDEVAQQFGEGAKVEWRLHPPTLKAMGMKNKIRLGSWFRPAFVMLRSLRGLRGTAFDPFGRDKVRVLERELIAEYELVIRGMLDSLNEAQLPSAIEIAGLPDLIRGYEDVKLRNVAHYRERLSGLQSGFTQHAHSQH